jgi:hypothetical protein
MVVLSMLRTEESSEMLAAELLAPKNKNTFFISINIHKNSEVETT